MGLDALTGEGWRWTISTRTPRDAALLEALADSLDGGAPPPLLRHAKIKLTSRCNIRCVMCKYWRAAREDRLTSERWCQVFRRPRRQRWRSEQGAVAGAREDGEAAHDVAVTAAQRVMSA